MTGANGSGDDERTVFRPAGGMQPGGQSPQSLPPSGSAPYVPPRPQPVSGMAPPPEPAKGRLDFATAEPDLYGPEPLVAAAGRLVYLASQIRSMPVGPDLGALRRLAIEELEAFGRRARNLGLEDKSIQLAHYILCAFIDDAVMSTPWGANSPWSQQSLLAAYHNDTQGGDRMFQFAERMEQDPNREPRLMELLYQCLSLGFEGRAALDPRGQSLLHQRRARLAGAIAGRTGFPSAELSPHWRGVTAAAGPFAPRIPLWAVLSGIAAIAVLIFAASLFRLSTQSDAAIALLDQAVGGAQIVPPPPPPQSETPTFDKMREILAPDIRAGRLDLEREGTEIVIRLHNQGLFGSGEADPASSWSDVFGRLAQAANLSKGPIRIEGHTDNQAIRSLSFPSNQELSLARARSVANAIAGAGLADSSRLSTAGFGDTRPIGDNKTDDGRRQNRRVELRVANDIAWR
ncbi:OmpA family protein [Sphingomonas sp. MAH-20]|uniref:OmpA family protein n=1 Tax=Sphingomonas horti TaxID=2682842 RepID=A0A6I4IZE7_9SPHN|nr:MULTISPECIES: type IVB secretion system protein IcmH/DotU [Sphingomonas]MBA2920539.1 DotU family type IV/VI secretion system protein [Sphingomonas sp. CGMCC 1.13658]MVO76791.1 OmpA family protein [Sphingomonas horti]